MKKCVYHSKHQSEARVGEVCLVCELVVEPEDSLHGRLYNRVAQIDKDKDDGTARTT